MSINICPCVKALGPEMFSKYKYCPYCGKPLVCEDDESNGDEIE